jgi:hypothetical protein
MPLVVTVGSTVQCAHGGTITLKSSQSKLTVDGNAALLATDIVGATISGCTVAASNSTAPCTTVASLIAGSATALGVGGTPVLLDSAKGLTNGLPQPATWNVASAGQAKLKAH